MTDTAAAEHEVCCGCMAAAASWRRAISRVSTVHPHPCGHSIGEWVHRGCSALSSHRAALRCIALGWSCLNLPPARPRPPSPRLPLDKLGTSSSGLGSKAMLTHVTTRHGRVRSDCQRRSGEGCHGSRLPSNVYACHHLAWSAEMLRLRQSCTRERKVTACCRA